MSTDDPRGAAGVASPPTRPDSGGVTDDERTVQWGFVLSRLARAALALVTFAVLVAVTRWLVIVSLLLGLGLLAAAVFASTRNFFAFWGYTTAFAAFTGLRTLADDLGSTILFDYVIRFDSALFGGTLPTAFLQASIRSSTLDVVAVALHVSWFVLPPLAVVYLWLRTDRLPRFAVAGAWLFALSFLCHALLPTAPPWMAAELGYVDGVARVLHEVLDPQAPSLTEAGYRASANDVAAMPSLHFALPMLLAIAVPKTRRLARLLLWLYTGLVGVEIVYMGEHYVADIVGGALLVLAAWRLAAGRAGRPSAPATVRGLT